MSDMPEIVCDWCDETDPQRQARCPVKGCGRAPLTPADAMRCPDVAALVDRAEQLLVCIGMGWDSDDAAQELGAAIAPFTKGLDG